MCEFHVKGPINPDDYYRALCAGVVKETISIMDIMNVSTSYN